jgi:hypothetical protein
MSILLLLLVAQIPTDYGPWQGEDGRVVSSADGRVHWWAVRIAGDPKLERWPPERGEAYLQWRDVQGQRHVERDGKTEDLGLDCVVDGIFSLPAQQHRYLITGWRFLGYDLRRFAEVVDVSGAHPHRVPGSFVVAGRSLDLLVIKSSRPWTGKARHSGVWNHWVRLRGGTLRMEVIPVPPGSAFERWNPQPYTMGEWDGDRFQMFTRGWGQLSGSP